MNRGSSVHFMILQPLSRPLRQVDPRSGEGLVPKVASGDLGWHHF